MSDRASVRPEHTVSRRAMFTSLAAGAAVAGTAGFLAGRDLTATTNSPTAATQSLYGERQPGIITPQQQYATFVAFTLLSKDMKTGEALTEEQTADRVRDLLADWTRTADALMRGRKPEPLKGNTEEHFDTDAIADGLAPANLTITVGLGPWLFRMTGRSHQQPRHLAELPEFDGDQLNPRWSGGDLLLQICADDPQVVSGAFLAMRARVLGICHLRWTQQGFLSHPDDGGTARNLMGYKDGTANPAGDDPDFDATVWSDDGEPDWFAGGSYLVFRKIRMRLPEWSLATAKQQDETMGRRRDSGAPLTGEDEFDEPDLAAEDSSGAPVIPADAHVRLVRDIPMYRRSFNYDYGFLTSQELEEDPHAEGTDGHSHDKHPYDAGLLFVAYLSDPAHFIEAQTKMSQSDRLNEFVVNSGSAIFAVPPGAPRGHALAERLLAELPFRVDGQRGWHQGASKPSSTTATPSSAGDLVTPSAAATASGCASVTA